MIHGLDVRSGLVWLVLVGACGTSPPPPPHLEPSGPANYFLAIEHHHDMSQTFRLMELSYAVDGAEVFARQSDDEPLEAPVCVFRELVQRGTHQVRVDIVYRGWGAGVFSYLSGYRFVTSSTYAVDVPGDAFGVRLVGSGYEGGGATTPLDERPNVRWAAEVERDDPAAGCRP